MCGFDHPQRAATCAWPLEWKHRPTQNHQWLLQHTQVFFVPLIDPVARSLGKLGRNHCPNTSYYAILIVRLQLNWYLCYIFWGAISHRIFLEIFLYYTCIICLLCNNIESYQHEQAFRFICCTYLNIFGVWMMHRNFIKILIYFLSISLDKRQIFMNV